MSKGRVTTTGLEKGKKVKRTKGDNAVGGWGMGKHAPYLEGTICRLPLTLVIAALACHWTGVGDSEWRPSGPRGPYSLKATPSVAP